MSACPRPQSRRLLTTDFVGRVRHVSDHGHQWITAGAVLARSDVFKSPPPPSAAGSDITVTQLRRILTAARVNRGDIIDTGLTLTKRNLTGPATTKFGTPGQLVRAGDDVLYIDAEVWRTWSRTGLEPRAGETANGPDGLCVSWWGVQRGTYVLLGVVMPRLFRYTTR